MRSISTAPENHIFSFTVHCYYISAAVLAMGRPLALTSIPFNCCHPRQTVSADRILLSMASVVHGHLQTCLYVENGHVYVDGNHLMMQIVLVDRTLPSKASAVHAVLQGCSYVRESADDVVSSSRIFHRTALVSRTLPWMISVPLLGHHSAPPQ